MLFAVVTREVCTTFHLKVFIRVPASNQEAPSGIKLERKELLIRKI